MLKKRLWPYLAALGPGLLAASAGNDAGGIATYASAGASYGYGLLWAMVIVTVCVGVVQEMSARMGAVTGKGFSDLVRETFTLRQTALILLTLLIANTGIIVSEFIGVAAAAELFGVSRYIAVPVLDKTQRFLGIVTVDDALAVLLPEVWQRRGARTFA